MKTPIQGGIGRLGRAFAQIETWAAVALTALVIAFGLLQIVLRNVFATGLVWGDTFLRHAVLWICLLGAARAAADDRHISIDILPRLLPARLRPAVRRALNALAAAVCALLVHASWAFVQSDRMAGDMAVAGIPLWWIQMIFPFSFAVMTARFAWNGAFDPAGGREGEAG